MTDHIKGKVIVVTGAAKGFGRLICEKAAARGAKIAAGDIDDAGLAETEAAVRAAGGAIVTRRTDVTVLAEMQALVAAAVSEFGAADVMINNAGVMPLAFFSDHARAIDAWTRCIDINIKGVLHGIVAAYDQMIAQGRGHVVNFSSIYGNYPVVGSGVYSASKVAVSYLSDSLRTESQGKIKVTTIRPTGVAGTNLASGVINPEALIGLTAQNAAFYGPNATRDAEQGDVDSIRYAGLAPSELVDAVITAIDQPWGVLLSDITVRASGEGWVL